MVYLALRRTPAPGFLPGIFSWLTCARLVTKFPHSGIVIDGRLYEATFKNGLHDTPFLPNGWVLKQVHIDPALVLARYARIKSARYDWFSLLAFVFPVRVSYSKWYYCYEWCSYALSGVIPTSRITAEDLLILADVINHGKENDALGMVR